MEGRHVSRYFIVLTLIGILGNILVLVIMGECLNLYILIVE